MPFDRVILHQGTGRRELTLPEFMAIPLPERIRHILTRDLAFFADGLPLDRSEALRRLNAWQGQRI